MSDNMYKEDDIDLKKNNNFVNYGLENKKSVTRRISYLNLQEYIEANKTAEKSGLETHQQWVGDAVSRENGIFNINFKVNDDEYEEFIKLYTKECLKNYGKMNIMEKPREIGPLVLDFDLKQTTSQRKLTSNEIMQVIECVNDTIMKYFSFNDNDILESYILMKERPFYNKKNTNYSDGFHVHYPKLYLSIEDRFLIFEESKKEIINKNLFSEVFNVLCSTDDFKNKNSSDNETEELINDSKTFDEENFDYVKNIYEQLSEKEKDEVHDSVFDSSPIKKNKWFLYGSGKNIGGKFNLYEVKYIFDYNAELIDEIPEREELINLLAIRWNFEVKVKPRKKSDYLNVIEYIRTKYINKNKINMNQAFLKSDKVNIESEDIISIDDKYMKSTNVENKFNYKANENENFKKIKDDIDITKKLVKLLSPNRAYNYNDWIVVGWALFNIDCTLLNEFIEFSKKASTKFKIGECEKIWKQCEERRDINGEGNGYTIASLYHWAKEDNFAGYKNLMSEKINALLDNGNINTDFDVAYIIFTMYQYEYVCSSIGKNIWWQFKDHKWSRIEEAYTLSKKMSEEVCRKFAELAADCYSQSNKESIAGYKSDLLRQKALNIGKLVERLKKSSFKQTIIKECSLLFYWENFEKEMDQNNYLVGFDDGVFDLQSGKFRNGYPDDLISKTVGYKYKNYTTDHPIIKDIEKFMKSIQPEEDMKRFVLCYCASLFEGGNKDQRFMIWTGCHAIDQGIMMADGSIKKVQDIKEGEKLMGDDSKPRKVLRLVRGNDIMCEIIPIKGDNFKVNLDHILSLTANDTIKYIWLPKENKFKLKWQELINNIPTPKYKIFFLNSENKQIFKSSTIYYSTKQLAINAIEEFKQTLFNNKIVIKKGDIIDISVKDYIKFSKKFGKNNYFLFKTGIEYSEQKLDIDPYLIGYWLGDEISSIDSVNNDKNIIEYFEKNIKEYHYKISLEIETDSNYFLNYLKKNNLINNKFIPKQFIFNSRKNRLRLLSGIIDSYKYYQKNMKENKITFKSKKLFDDVLFLVRSLGFNTYKSSNNIKNKNYYSLKIITDTDINLISSPLENKLCKQMEHRKNHLFSNFKIKILDKKEDYYGFQVDGNNRYLMDDFTVTHNCGSNGKGTLINLLSKTLGKYYGTVPPTFLTQKRGNSSQATPELADKYGTRLLTTQEPENTDSIHIGFMKNITGGDEIMARPLYGDPFTYVPQFKLVMACNRLPNIPEGGDGGVWRRIRVVDFGEKFVDKPSAPNEHPKDRDLPEKLPKWTQAFTWLLLNIYYPIYKKYKDIDEITPAIVFTATKKYEMDTNVYMEFINETIEFDDSESIDKSDLWGYFKHWHSTSYDGVKIPHMKKFYTYLDNNNFKIKGSIVKGIKLKAQEERKLVNDLI